MDINSIEYEKEIVKKILSKDEKVFRHFMLQNQKALYNFIKRQLHDPDLTQELVQDVFVDFLEALRGFEHQARLKTYLFSIAKFKVIDVIRKKKVKKILFSSLPDYIVEGLAPVLIDDSLEQKELQEKIATIINQLPQEYRIILRLKYIDGQRVKVIAKKLSLTFKATESLLFRARQAFIKGFNCTV